MEKPNEISPHLGYYYIYDAGFQEKKCIEKLSEVTAEFLTTMDSDTELCELKKQIEKLHKKYNNYNSYNGGINDAC